MKLSILFVILLSTLTAQATLRGQIEYRGIGRISYDGPGAKVCSMSLVRFDTSLETDTAIILTNAHCIQLDPSMIPAQEVPYYKKFELLNAGSFLSEVDLSESPIPMDLRNPRDKAAGLIWGQRLTYFSRSYTDIAIIQLEETYQELEKRGFHPLTLSREEAKADETIAIATGLYDEQYNCNVAAKPDSVVVDVTVFKKPIRYSEGCEVIPGTSGSPVISKRTGLVVAVNALRNEPKNLCTAENACEYTKGKPSYPRYKTGYGTQTSILYSCLNDERKVDLSIKGCQLFGAKNP